MSSPADPLLFLPAWVSLTQDEDVSVGIAPEDAFQHASELRRRLLTTTEPAVWNPLDDNTKDVVHALVALICTAPPSLALASEANRVYQFLSRLEWPSDGFDERHHLLSRCTEAGYAALGLTLLDVERRRRDGVPPVTSSLSQQCFGKRTPGDGDDLASALHNLREKWDTSPQTVTEEAAVIYDEVKTWEFEAGLFDQRAYLLGQAALVAGVAHRLTGCREESICWLNRAESAFRNTVNPDANLADVAYARLSLVFEAGKYGEVLESIGDVRSTFERTGLSQEAAKCRLLQAMALKAQGAIDEGLRILEPIRVWSDVEIDRDLKGRIYSEMGDLYQLQDRLDQAIGSYQQALAHLDGSRTSQARADLKTFVGEAYRRHGQPRSALTSFRSAISDYRALGMTTRTAYLRLFIADTLVALGRHGEAETEILAALPTIEEQKMVPEGFAAVALLKESVRRRKTDPTALRELREHLQAKQ